MRAEVEQAVTLLQQKDPAAVDRALALLQHTVFNFSMRVCGHREDAEDTMQDVLMKSLRYLPEFTSPKALAVWLYKVARNRCLMSRRRSKFAPREHLSLEELLPDRQELESLAETDGPSPEQSLLADENADLVRDSVLKIPAAYRLILVLHDMEELSTEEVARITGLREGTVRVRLHRARLFLRKEMERRRRAAAGAHSHVRPAPAKRPGRCKELFGSLSDYLDGTLDAAVCEELEKHLAGCTPCKAFLNDLRLSIAQLKRYHPAGPDPATAAQIRAALLDAYRRVVTQKKTTAASN
jgi:RNA polymerase sigma-70 factor (ECF subfamily)